MAPYSRQKNKPLEKTQLISRSFHMIMIINWMDQRLRLPANHLLPSGFTVYLCGVTKLYQTTLPVEKKSATLNEPAYWLSSTVAGSAASSN